MVPFPITAYKPKPEERQLTKHSTDHNLTNKILDIWQTIFVVRKIRTHIMEKMNGADKTIMAELARRVKLIEAKLYPDWTKTTSGGW